jgi:hypothetical protein
LAGRWGLGRCWANCTVNLVASELASIVKRNALAGRLVRGRRSTSAGRARNYCTGTEFSFQGRAASDGARVKQRARLTLYVGVVMAHLKGRPTKNLRAWRIGSMRGASAWRAAGERARLRVREISISGNRNPPPFARIANVGATVKTRATEKSKTPARRRRYKRQRKRQRRRPEASGTNCNGGAREKTTAKSLGKT